MATQPTAGPEREIIRANVDRLSKLYAAVVADCCDEAGYRHQILAHTVRPLKPQMRVVGAAYTVLCVEVYALPKAPYVDERRTLDTLQPLDVLVATTNGATSFALWSERLATRARHAGASGAVIDGFARDARRLIAMDCSTFCTGLHLGDTKGRGDVIASGVPIRCAGVQVNPGDYVIGDIDGVCVVPQEAISRVLALAEAKVAGEDRARSEDEAERGVRDVNEYGVM